MRPNPQELVHLLINEAFLHRNALVGLFVFISLAMSFAGFTWPKGYTSTTTILVDEKNIIRPLMEGTAVTTEIMDRARLAGETIFGRKVLNQVLEKGGWLTKPVSREDDDRLIRELKGRTKITNLGRNLIKIEYNDDDPERAYAVTKLYADLFIEESLQAKALESQAAYEFIDKQVQEYHEKLAIAEDELKDFRSSNLDAPPGSEMDISRRLDTLRARIETAAQELKEAEIRKQSLEKQVSGEAESATALSRENQYRARIAELQARLETLRLSYHDTYPDIVQIRQQIADLNQSIERDRAQREAVRVSGKIALDESVLNNPTYQQLRLDLSKAQIAVDTLKARIADAQRQLQAETDRGRRAHGGAVAMAELTRDYQVNRDIYQDLLRRRERARVSMNLDKERQGLTFRVQEPASVPVRPSGLRFLHFLIGGLILGVAVPGGLLYAKVQFDPRVRTGRSLTERHGIPLLAAIPHYWTPAETRSVRREARGLVLAILATAGIMATLIALRITGTV